jgi:Mrp family chromosome partitioning ATPase
MSQLKDTLAKVRSEFDFVVIDASPVLTFADALLFGSHVDGAVLSVRRDHSQIPKVYEARERLEAVGVPVLGSVVHGVNDKAQHKAYLLPAKVA